VLGFTQKLQRAIFGFRDRNDTAYDKPGGRRLVTAALGPVPCDDPPS
jgi:hypothetical protein